VIGQQILGILKLDFQDVYCQLINFNKFIKKMRALFDVLALDVGLPNKLFSLGEFRDSSKQIVGMPGWIFNVSIGYWQLTK